MPIEYKIYGCQFMCGTRHRKNIKEIQEHEEKCWYNPKNKTCITCSYGKIVSDFCDHPEMEGCPTEYWKYRECHEESNLEMEFKQNSFGQNIIPITDCSKWKSKKGDN
ncbi:hypothetical protein [Clostridium saccharoperbutylacetonicum]|uniref:hypothetical protein n=1 Tax=Clostridium saccharoperbutylacetonicum TaxID=36745 RepID=UPI0039EBFBCD